VLAVAHPWASASSYLSSQSLSDSRFNLRATSWSPPSRRALPCRFFLCRVALLCLILRCRRRLPFPCSLGFFRLSAQLRPPCCISCGPSSLSSSPRARTTLLTPTAIICRPVISLLRSTLSSNTCAFTDDAGAGVPFGCIVTADNGISTGSSSSESSSPASFRSALRSVRSAWLTLHAVNRRPIHPMFFSRSLCPCLGLVVVSHPCLYGNRGCLPHYL